MRISRSRRVRVEDAGVASMMKAIGQYGPSSSLSSVSSSAPWRRLRTRPSAAGSRTPSAGARLPPPQPPPARPRASSTLRSPSAYVPIVTTGEADWDEPRPLSIVVMARFSIDQDSIDQVRSKESRYPELADLRAPARMRYATRSRSESAIRSSWTAERSHSVNQALSVATRAWLTPMCAVLPGSCWSWSGWNWAAGGWLTHQGWRSWAADWSGRPVHLHVWSSSR